MKVLYSQTRVGCSVASHNKLMQTAQQGKILTFITGSTEVGWASGRDWSSTVFITQVSKILGLLSFQLRLQASLFMLNERQKVVTRDSCKRQGCLGGLYCPNERVGQVGFLFHHCWSCNRAWGRFYNVTGSWLRARLGWGELSSPFIAWRGVPSPGNPGECAVRVCNSGHTAWLVESAFRGDEGTLSSSWTQSVLGSM